MPCCWIQEDLCSGCATFRQIVEAPGGIQWLIHVTATGMKLDEIKERISKLLVRTEDRGATPAEAAQAIELAKRLLDKHGLLTARFHAQYFGRRVASCTASSRSTGSPATSSTFSSADRGDIGGL